MADNIERHRGHCGTFGSQNADLESFEKELELLMQKYELFWVEHYLPEAKRTWR